MARFGFLLPFQLFYFSAIDVIRDQNSDGVAFIDFATADAAKAAIKLNGREFEGRAWKIEFATAAYIFVFFSF